MFARPGRWPLARAAVAAGTMLAVLVLPVLPASAHVTVHSPEARSGGTDAAVTVRVPNERDDASTVRVQVALPQDTPLIGVLLRPLAGWTSTLTTVKLAKPVKTDDGTITEAAGVATWSGGRIGPGQYQDFELDVSQLPEAKSVEFKVVQTYSDGGVVRWIESPAQGQPEPEHPTATLSLTGAATAAAPAAASAAPTATATAASVRTATGLAIAGLVLAVAAGVLGGLALARRRNA